MASEKIACEYCGQMVDIRGLTGHQRSKSCKEARMKEFGVPHDEPITDEERQAMAADPQRQGQQALEKAQQEVEQRSTRLLNPQQERRRRVPLGVPRLKLEVATTPGKVGRWVNDVGDRINAAIDGGYEHVTGPDGTQRKKVVGTKEDGSSMTAYYMEIDKELYDEDQAAKQAEIDVVDRQIKEGTFDQRPGDMRYIPSTGIKITEDHKVPT